MIAVISWLERHCGLSVTDDSSNDPVKNIVKSEMMDSFGHLGGSRIQDVPFKDDMANMLANHYLFNQIIIKLSAVWC